ncbi:hypothetical protein J3D54_004170 [Pseudomonas sp. GGS8]|nr:hypothetical protein [Pseudomonas sp. GGS8]
MLISFYILMSLIKVSTRTAERRDYHPDFYLPAFDLYIEHFGTDRQGNTAPYVDRKT